VDGLLRIALGREIWWFWAWWIIGGIYDTNTKLNMAEGTRDNKIIGFLTVSAAGHGHAAYLESCTHGLTAKMVIEEMLTHLTQISGVGRACVLAGGFPALATFGRCDGNNAARTAILFSKALASSRRCRISPYLLSLI
jgi:hypothetical protein